MANKNETTTKFKVDISELKKAMQDAKRQVAIANSEFKAVSSTMDDWTKSSDGLSAKIKQLDTNLKSQDKILESLEEQYRLTVEEMGEGSKAAEDLQIKINNQKAVIGNTKRQIEKYNEALQELAEGGADVADSTKDVANSLEEVADKAEDAGDGFTTFKGAVAGFVANVATSFVGVISDAVSSLVSLADETREYRTELGKLETAFTSAGFGADTATSTYKDFYAILGDEGQAVEAVNHLALLAENQEDLAKWTTIATGVYGTFGSSLPIENLTEASNETAKTGQLTGGLADALNWAGVSEDAFQESLDKCNTEQERQALITETLTGLYSEAAETYKEVNGDIMDAQRAQSELADATANLGAVAEPVMTSFKLMGAALLTELLPSVTELGAGFTDLINGVEGADQRIGSAIGSIGELIIGKIVAILPELLNVGLSLVVTLIKGVLEALPQLVTTVISLVGTIIETLATALPQVAQAVIEAIPLIIDALMKMLPTLIDSVINFLLTIVDAIPTLTTAIINALPQVITSIIDGLLKGSTALLKGAITLLMSIVEAIPQIIKAIVKALPEIIGTIITNLLNAIPLLLEASIELFMAIIDSVPQITVALIEAMPTLIMAIIQSLIEAIPLLLETSVKLFMTLVEAIPQIVVALLGAVPQIVMAIITTLGALIPQLGELLSSAWTTFKTWISNLMTTVQTQIPLIINAVVQFFSQLPSKIWTWLVEVVNKVDGWRVNLVAKGKEVIQNLVEVIMLTIGKLPERIKSAGKDIVRGLWNGINDMASWIKSKIEGFGEDILDDLKDFFGIASPSKVMAAEVGRWLPEGIAVGIDKNAKTVLQSMKDATMGAVSGARAGLSSAGTVGEVGTAGASSVVNNFYQTNNSPKALSRLEIYRQTSNLLGFAGGV